MPITLDALSYGNGARKTMAISQILFLAAIPHSWMEAGIWAGMTAIAAMIVRKSR
jgi:hypothetical protein